MSGQSPLACKDSDNSRWMYNDLSQTPCQVLSSSLQQLNASSTFSWLDLDFTCPRAPQGSDNPSATALNSYCCSTISFSLYSACWACQWDQSVEGFVRTTVRDYLSNCTHSNASHVTETTTARVSQSSTVVGVGGVLEEQARRRLDSAGITTPKWAFLPVANIDAVWNENLAHLNATGSNTTLTNNPTSESSLSVTKKLSGGAIAGIVIAILVFLGVIACAVCGVYIPHRRRQRVEKLKQSGFYNSSNNNMVLQDAKKTGGFYPFRRTTTKEKEGGTRSNGNSGGGGGGSGPKVNLMDWIPSGATLLSLLGRKQTVRVGGPKRKQPSPLHQQQPRQRIDLALDEDAELASPVSVSTKGHAWNSGHGNKHISPISRDNSLAVPGMGRQGTVGAGQTVGAAGGGGSGGGVFLPTLVGGLPPSPRDRVNTYGVMNDDAAARISPFITPLNHGQQQQNEAANANARNSGGSVGGVVGRLRGSLTRSLARVASKSPKPFLGTGGNMREMRETAPGAVALTGLEAGHQYHHHQQMPPTTNTNNDLQPRNSISVPFPDPTHYQSAPYSVPLSPTQLQQSQPSPHDPSNPYHQPTQQQQQQQPTSSSANPAAVAAPRIQFPSNKNPAVQPAPIVPLTKEALQMARVAHDGSLFVPVNPAKMQSAPALPTTGAEKMPMPPQQPPYARQNSFPLTEAQQYRNERDPLVRTVSIERYKSPPEQRHGHIEAADIPARGDSLHRQLVLHEVRDDDPLVPVGAGGGTRKGKGKKKKDGDGRVSPDEIAYGTANTSAAAPIATSSAAPAPVVPISKANLQILGPRGPKSDHTSVRAKDGSMIGSSTQFEEAEEAVMASRSAFDSATMNTSTALMSPSDDAVSPATDLRANRQKHNNGKGKRTHSHNLSDTAASASGVRSDGSQTPSPKIAPSAEWFDLFRRGTVPTTFPSNPSSSEPAKGLGVNLFGQSEKEKDKAVDLTRNRTAPQPSTHDPSKRRKGSGELFNQLVSSNQPASSSGASDVSRSSSFYRPMVAALLEPSTNQPKPTPAIPPAYRERTQSDNMLTSAATKPTPAVPSRERKISDNMLTSAGKPTSEAAKLEPKNSDPLLRTQKATPNTGFTGSNSGPGLGSRDKNKDGASVERATSHPTWSSGISGGRALPTEPNRRIPMSLAMNRSLPMSSVSHQSRSLPTEPPASRANPPATRPSAPLATQPAAVVDTSRAQPATTLFTSPVSTSTTSQNMAASTTTSTRTSTDRSERPKPRGVRMLPPIPQPPEPERRHTFD